MRARREHTEARAGAGRSPTARTRAAHTEHCQTNCFAAWTAALCEASGVRRLAGRGAGVRARARPHGAAARHVPPVARRHRRHRGGPQDGVRGVSSSTRRETLELLRSRRRNLLRTRHAHCDERGGVHIRHHFCRRDPRAECGVRARRPARLPVYHQPSSQHVDVGAVRVGRLRRRRVRRAAGAALPGRARAGARRARAHEPAQQPRGPEDSEGPGPPRVQVPRRVGLVRREDVLARAAALPRRRRRAARALRPRQARGAQLAAPRARRPAPGPSAAPCARTETEAEPGRAARAAQVGAGVPGAVAVVLRARRRRRLLRHAPQDLQQDFQRRRRLRVPVLRARLQHGAARAGDQVQLPLPLVLPRHLRHLRPAHRDARLQLSALSSDTSGVCRRELTHDCPSSRQCHILSAILVV